ncbi:MAG: SRPBCC family protein [Actinomycetota bacterium]|nr:SRPBCC family protein [Actinomycetota bacterium]
MGRVDATQRLGGRVADAEALWYDLARWPAFVEGFEAVESVEHGWPREGGELTWRSIPAGRGRVTERVTRHEVRRGQESQVADDQLTGTQTVSLRPLEEGCEIKLVLDYRLKTGPLMAVVDLLFVRRAVRASLRRTLAEFARELAGAGRRM